MFVCVVHVYVLVWVCCQVGQLIVSWKLQAQLFRQIRSYNKKQNKNCKTNNVNDILDFIQTEADLPVQSPKNFALHKSEGSDKVRILAMCSVKIISHIQRLKTNLQNEGHARDWFSTIGENQDFVLLGPRRLTNLPVLGEGAMGCRAPLGGLASLEVHN